MADETMQTLAARIDAICREFEAALRRGERPLIDDFVMRAAPYDRDLVSRELALIGAGYGGLGADEESPSQDRESLGTVSVPDTLGAEMLPPYAAPLAEEPNVMASVRHVEPLALPQIGSVARYEIRGELGQGGMGVVYRAFDVERQREVALKKLPRLDAVALYRFKQEFRALADLAHPNLVTLHELVSDGEHWFFTMELIEGRSFLSYVRSSGEPDERHRLPALERREHWPSKRLTARDVQRLRDVLRQLAEALTTLHAAGKIHRDIKPSNVLVTGAGRLVLLDFGLAAELNQDGCHQSTSQHLVGTIAYMAPEQASCQGVSPATDWYAVGAMLYEVLTGQLPFTGSALEILRAKQERDPVPPRDLALDIPGDLNDLCLQLLLRTPEARPSGDEILRRLAASRATTPPVLPVVLPGPPATLLGRQGQLELLANAFQAVCNRRTVLTFVHGQSGIGKTALVRKFLDGLGSDEGTLILSGRCYEQESVPYKAVDTVVDALTRYLSRLSFHEARALLPRDVTTLARLFPVLSRVPAVAAFPHGVDVRDPQELRRRAFTALRELLARLGDTVRLVISIDDLQWGDLDSMELLSVVLRPPEAPVLLLVGSYRREDMGTSPFLQAMQVARRRVDNSFDWREIAVDPLPANEACLLARDLLGEQYAAEADNVAKESGGNPFFLHELAQHALMRGSSPSSATSVGLTLEDVIWDRVQRLPSEAAQLLSVLAVAGRPLRQNEALSAVDLTESQSTHFGSLRMARLIRGSSVEHDGVETYHDRVRETVRSKLPDPVRRDYHARLASTLEAGGNADPEFLAGQWEQAGNAVHAAELFLRAAEQAAQSLAFDRSATLYHRALELGDFSAAQRRSLQMLLGDALANAGRGREAAKEYLKAAEGGDTNQILHCKHRAAKQLLVSGYVEEGVQLLRAVLRSLNLVMPASPARALWSYISHRAWLRLRGFKFKTKDPADIPAEVLARIDVCWSAAIGLCMTDFIQALPFQTHGLLLALKAGDPFRIARAMSLEAGHTATEGSGSQRRTHELVQEAERLQRDVPHPYVRGMFLTMKGSVEYLNGRYKAAFEADEEGLKIFREQCTGVAWEVDTSNIFSLWSLTYLGDIALLSRRWPALLQEARSRGNRFTVTFLSTYIMSVVRLAADDADGAWNQLQRVMKDWPTDGFHVQHHNALLAHTLIELYRGHADNALRYLLARWPAYKRSLLVRIQQTRVDFSQLRGRAALAVAKDLPDPRPMLRRALSDARRLEREKTPWASALATLIRAGAAAGERDFTGASFLYRKAAESLDAVDMRIYAASARRRLGEIIGGQEGRDLIDAADHLMRQEEIRDPVKMSLVFAPRAFANE
ncbi:MAG TPA: protein kinase [Pirellulales bacterium]|nr:protein kinase [Pirellulales bacterium]